jgi:hypothetical protein
LEEELAEVKTRMEQLMREKQSYESYIENMNLEKEEMIRSHTNETGELRKKVSVLTDHVHRLECAALPTAVPAANAFHGGYDDMEGMAMAGGWESVGIFGEYPIEADVKQEAPMAKKNEIPFPTDMEKTNSQGGLLFMLFLVGAFVLSSRSTPSIPRVSEDVRTASATLLENVLKDAGVGAASSAMEAVAPQPSGSAWAGPAAIARADAGMDGVMPSMLGELGDALTQPSRDQTNEQLFSLSAAQYNGVASQDFLQNAPEQRSTSQGRRNLADALAAMRNNNKQQSAAEVYTRSLLWDQIPSEVVRNFAKMVAEVQQNDQRNDAGTT